jgi:uncharacterized protein involved in type VI secretion and phage assembly
VIRGEGHTYFGKYKGRVFNNLDPKGLGRIQVQVADVIGLNVSNWAMPCLPFTGLQSGFYLVPPLNAGVWVEFEQGDIDHPIWTGCWWGGREELPLLAQAPVPPSPPMQNIVLQSIGQYSISINDRTGIRIASPSGAVIIVSDAGITINNGKGATIDVFGPVVSINGNALIVK